MSTDYLTKSKNFFLLAGPCVVESRDICFEIAEHLKEITNKLNIPFVFKASYRKANRSKGDSFSGIGDTKALQILSDIRKELSIHVVTDIHAANEAEIAAKHVDIIQIPAFLCRQTDLLIAAARTGKIINIKKGQFLAPQSMKFAVEKITSSGNSQVMLTERGTMFGYGDLIVDYRGIIQMQKFGFPVILDITHSLQQPNQPEGVSGGIPDLIETIARAGISVGVDGIFMETHPQPSKAKSDGANMLQLNKVGSLLEKLTKIKLTVNDL
ncbi:MAG: 3-deoxy-8-phosphooctulonate synthase [Bacteroidales bacterium]|nr:3-deoxy-8-phosphooctulonate synthase [Bacteroidales bacterium]